VLLNKIKEFESKFLICSQHAYQWAPCVFSPYDDSKCRGEIRLLCEELSKDNEINNREEHFRVMDEILAVLEKGKIDMKDIFSTYAQQRKQRL